MAGHSKWANIQHRKWAQDKKKWKIYWKHSKLIAIAARWWDDVDKNAALRVAIDNAKAENVPKDIIKRAVEKWAWTWKDAAVFTEWLYEAYWPWWVAVLISTLSDNTNRTFTEVKNVISKKWWNFAESWSVSWMFWKKWEIAVNLEWKDIEEFEMFILESWAEDFEVFPEENLATVITEISDFTEVRDRIKNKWYELQWASIAWIPSQKISLEDEEKNNQLQILIEWLEENEDVDDVYTNLEN